MCLVSQTEYYSLSNNMMSTRKDHQREKAICVIDFVHVPIVFPLCRFSVVESTRVWRTLFLYD